MKCSCCKTYEGEESLGPIDVLCRYCIVLMNWESDINILVDTKDLFGSLFKKVYTYMDIRKIIITQNDLWQKYKKEIDKMYDKLQELA